MKKKTAVLTAAVLLCAVWTAGCSETGAKKKAWDASENSIYVADDLSVQSAMVYTSQKENDRYSAEGLAEFAKEQMEHGMGLIEATLEAVRLRLRPILMTSLAFVLGVLPLVRANGAGSGSQNAIGTGVMGGMISATVLAIFFIPVFFVVVRKIFKARKHEDD